MKLLLAISLAAIVHTAVAAPAATVSTVGSCTFGNFFIPSKNGQASIYDKGSAGAACDSVSGTFSDITAAHKTDATQLIENCLGTGNSAWVKSYDGNTYGVNAIRLYSNGAVDPTESESSTFVPICTKKRTSDNIYPAFTTNSKLRNINLAKPIPRGDAEAACATKNMVLADLADADGTWNAAAMLFYKAVVAGGQESIARAWFKSWNTDKYTGADVAMTINTAYEGKQASANAYTGQLLDNVVCFDPNNPHPSCPADAPEEESTKCGKDVEDASLPVGTPCTSGDLYAVPRDKQGAVMVVTSSKRKETCDAIGMNVAMATSYNKNNLYNAVNTCVGSNGKAWVQGYDGFTAHNYGMLVWGPPAGTDQKGAITAPIKDKSTIDMYPVLCVARPVDRVFGCDEHDGNLRVVSLSTPVARKDASNECRRRCMDWADLKDIDGSWVSAVSLLFDSLGPRTRAWFKSWNGDSYQGTNVAMWGGDTPNGAAASAYNGKLSTVICKTRQSSSSGGILKRSDL